MVFKNSNIVISWDCREVNVELRLCSWMSDNWVTQCVFPEINWKPIGISIGIANRHYRFYSTLLDFTQWHPQHSSGYPNPVVQQEKTGKKALAVLIFYNHHIFETDPPRSVELKAPWLLTGCIAAIRTLQPGCVHHGGVSGWVPGPSGFGKLIWRPAICNWGYSMHIIIYIVHI